MKHPKLRTEIKKGECGVVGCKTKPSGKFCRHHWCQVQRAKDPVRYSYNNKKSRAKQRGIFWDLTIEQFRQFCYETEYISKTGKITGSYDVDRIIEGPIPGYTITNIQILEKIANIKKYKKYSDESKKAETVVEIIIPPEDLPF
jgi:hypothetical protein